MHGKDPTECFPKLDPRPWDNQVMKCGKNYMAIMAQL